MSANCFIVTGKAENNSNKPVYDADIFGRIYDANNDSVMQNRTRLGSITEVPPGVSDFELRISVPNQPTPLKLKQFKAAGFSAQVRGNCWKKGQAIKGLYSLTLNKRWQPTDRPPATWKQSIAKIGNINTTQWRE